MNAQSRDPFLLDADEDGRLATYLSSAAEIFKKLAIAAGATSWMADDVGHWARHPLGMGLARLAIQGELTPSELQTGMTRLRQVPKETVQIIASGGIAVDADGASFSLDTDRGVSLALIPVDRHSAQVELDGHVQSATAILGESWRGYIRPVATLCLVGATGYAAIPHYSGSSNSLFGAMQSGGLTAPWVTAEVITHEAAHMWLSLIEDKEEFAEDGWTEKGYLSPWRDDARPISGIVHGVYVFSMVAAALARWVQRDGPFTDEVQERLALVCAQVRSAAATVMGHPSVIPFVRVMTEAALERISASELELPPEIMNRATVRLAEHAARWRAAHPHLVNAA